MKCQVTSGGARPLNCDVMPSDADPTPIEQRHYPVLGTLVKLVENPASRKVVRWFLSPLLLVPAFRRSMRILRSVDRIDEFERQEEFEQARALREQLLQDTEDANAAPLWRSEGNDRLYRIRDYQGALQAFERAMTSLDQAPSMYGVALPDQIYYGAALGRRDAWRQDKRRTIRSRVCQPGSRL